MTVQPVTTDDADELLELADMNEWDEFVKTNHDDIVVEYGTVANALKVCRDGGLMMGGGAAPLFLIHFKA